MTSRANHVYVKRIKKLVSLHLTEAEWAAFREACEDEHRTIGEVLSGVARTYTKVREATFQRLWETRGLRETAEVKG